MEAILMDLIMKALVNGDVKGFLAFLAIFTLIWVQVRGVKKAIESLALVVAQSKSTMEQSFKDGEKRFENIENNLITFEGRIKALEVLTAKGAK